MSFKNRLPLVILLVLSFSCSDKPKESANLTNETEVTTQDQFLIGSQGDTILTGVAIATQGKRIDPDSVAKPKIIPFRGKTKVVPVQTNIHPVGGPKVVPIPKELIEIIPGKNGVPPPNKVPARGIVLPVLHSPSIPASPLAFKDDATAGFQYLGLAQGLTFPNVHSIFEDSRGYIWLGGNGGVCRYDGVSFTYFTAKENFPLHYVWPIFEDSRGIFWFGSERDGLCRYDGVNFTHYTTEEGLSSNWVWSVLEDEKGYLWFGTKGGVSRYDPHDHDGQGAFTHFTTQEGLIGNDVRSMWADSRGYLWFGTAGLEAKGVCRYDATSGESGSFTHYTTDDGLISNHVTSILEESHGGIWFGTWENGVCRFDPDAFQGQGSFTHYTTKEGMASNVVLAMIEDTRGNLWFGGRGGSVTLYKPGANEARGSFTHFTQEEGMSGDFVMDIMEDNRGNIWFGMLPGGVNCYHPSGFTYYTTKNGLTQNAVRGWLKDSRGAIWIGHLGAFTIYEPRGDGLGSAKFIQYATIPIDYLRPRMEDSRGNIWMAARSGVARYVPDPDRRGGRFTHFTAKEGLSSDQVSGMLEDKRGNLWFATNNGVSCYVRNSEDQEDIGGSFTHFTTKEGLSGDQVSNMLEDKRGNLWFTTNNGLSCYDPDDKARDGISGYFTHFSIPKGASVSNMLEDSRGNLWFGARKGGLYRFVPDPNAHDVVDGTLVLFTIEDGLIDNGRIWIIEDSDGNIWFSTENGLSRFAPGGPGRSFTHYTTEEGLSGNYVGKIIEDKQKNIWISTNGGISLLVPLADEDASSNTGNYQIISYNKSNRLKQLDRAHQVVLDSSFHRIWWGSNEGLTMLDLNQFQAPNASPAGVSLNAIEIKRNFIDYRRLQDTAYQSQLAFGERLVGSFDSVPAFSNYPLNLSLPHSLNHLTFHFSAIDWQAPYNLKYRYFIEGLEDEWSPPSPENKADYRNLPTGSYTFKVKAIGAAQIESTVFAYDFRILPPWWLTWWAYVIYGGLILLLLYGIRSYELGHYRAQSENRRLKELDAFKTRLYTNITHEFRTPLTIILGMARQIKDDPKKWYNEGLHMIVRNGRQLLSLVNQMLDLSKLDKGKVKLNLQQGEVVAFTHYLVQSFESFAASKNVQLHLLKEIDQLIMDFDPDQLTKVVSNLLSNAVKYTPEDGQVYVTIRQQVTKADETAEFLELRVKDTGPGIPLEELPHIFDRFYQVDGSATRKAGGTGLGLALTKELVQLMGGEIQVQSKIGEGADFNVFLPVRRSAPKADMAIESKVQNFLQDDPNGETDMVQEAATYPPPMNRAKQVANLGSASVNDDLPLVLLIEDNRDVLTYLASCLEADYQLEFAVNGQEGIEQALEIIPDVIISDVMMPKKDGYEVCASLKEDIRTSHIPIILLTAKSDRDAKLEGLRAGADAYLAKPFDKEELAIRLVKLLDLRRQLQARYSHLQPAAHAEGQGMTKEELFLKELWETVEDNLSDESFGIAQLCRKIGMSRSQMHNKLKALTGQSASIYLRAIRLEKAKELLRNTDLNISEVAYEVGFRTPLYFTQVFSEEVGVAPSVFRMNASAT